MSRLINVISIFLLLMLCLPASVGAQDSTVDLGLITVKQKALAEKLRKQILDGASFEELAKKNSVGPAAARGGRLGNVPYKRLRSEYKAALKNLAPNTPSAVIPTEEGYNILMHFKETSKQAAADKTPGKAPAPITLPHLAARQSVMAGVESLAAGDVKAGEKAFTQAIGQNPYDSNATFFMDIVRQMQAGKLKEKAVKTFAFGFIDMLRGDSAEAQKKFRQAAAQDPKFWQALLLDASLQMADAKKDKQTLSLLKKVLAINPKSARAHIYLGMLALSRGRVAEGKKELETAVKLNPKLPDGHYHLGALALEENKLKLAEQNLRAAIAADPYKEEAYNDLGVVMADTKRPAEAEKYYRRTLELNPGFAAAHLNLGELYGRHGYTNRAMQEFEKALILDPNLPQAHCNLAIAYAQKKQWDQAISHADQAKKLNLTLPESLEKLLKPHRTQKEQ